jgi:hypothetical protein
MGAKVIAGGVAAVALVASAAIAIDGAAPQEPVARAASFLAREVPRWRRDHPCYSCHNNGDAARALIAAQRSGVEIGDALSDTLAFLSRPKRWAGNAQGGGVEDMPLMRIQFASALSAAVDERLVPHAALAEAAALLADDQGDDGSWRLDSSQSLGSPATYGTALATAIARRTLSRVEGEPRYRDAVARADRWLRRVDAVTVLDAAGVTIGLDGASDDLANAQRERCLDVLRRGQAPDGGWGPYVTSASEPFDTAIAVLALTTVRSSVVRAATLRGREFLIARQRDDGSWDETTRPARQESYAQRISTTGWATLAVLAADWAVTEQ